LRLNRIVFWVVVLIGGCATTQQVSETEEAIAPIAFGELPIYVSSESGLELSEQQKLGVIEAPRRLIAQPSEHLRRAFRSGLSKVFVIDESDKQMTGFQYTALMYYVPITYSETRLVEPAVVCEGDGLPPRWITCFDNSDFFAVLPNHAPIRINDESMTDEQVMKILEAVNQAKLRTPTDVPVTSKDVDHILLRSRRSGVYVVTAQTPNREGAEINLKHTVVDGNESYEITEWSCR
jgi:hypothetical protein